MDRVGRGEGGGGRGSEWGGAGRGVWGRGEGRPRFLPGQDVTRWALEVTPQFGLPPVSTLSAAPC